MVVYSFVNTSLQIAIDILQGNAYEFEVSNIINTLSVPFGWIAVLWVDDDHSQGTATKASPIGTLLGHLTPFNLRTIVLKPQIEEG